MVRLIRGGPFIRSLRVLGWYADGTRMSGAGKVGVSGEGVIFDERILPKSGIFKISDF